MANTVNNSSLNLVDLDFDTLKASLVAYLQTKPEFKDYDFSGPNLSVLTDLLTHNTRHNAFFTNMLFSESFLDSAQLRSSVLSHAKELNYLPRSARSAKATVTCSFTATGDSQPYYIPKGSTFSTLVKDSSYVFSVPETIKVDSVDTNFEVTMDIYEGVYVKDSFIMNGASEYPRFRISNKMVDTNSLTVSVYEDGAVVGDAYVYSTTLLGLNENSKVYFLQASEEGYYEVQFGDGVIGRRPNNGSVIVLEYRITEGNRANGAKVFNCNFDPTGELSELTSDVTVDLPTYSADGSLPEEIESVRYYAPRHFQVQERAVVPTDYEILLKEQFPEINAVSVIGGEELDPPSFGKVFISVDLSNVSGIPESKKSEYIAFLSNKMSMTIRPEIIVPEYLYFQVKSNINYNLALASKNDNRIRSLVTNAILEFNSTYLDDFDVKLRASKLFSHIDNSETSIISNETAIKVYKKITPVVNSSMSYTVKYGIPLKSNLPIQTNDHSVLKDSTLLSSNFTYNGMDCVLQDDGSGNIYINKRENNIYSQIEKIGTIDYATGTVELYNLVVSNYRGGSIKLYAIPEEYDIEPSRNNILTTETTEIILNINGTKE